MINLLKKNDRQYATPSNNKKQLISAVSFLLVSSVLMVQATFAWLTISNSPEVVGIQTQVTGNGNLEIALASKESVMDPSLLQGAPGDSGYSNSEKYDIAANTKWGNLVDLGDPYYGLQKVTLYPCTLNIDGVAVQRAPINIASYGHDGRVELTDKNSVCAFYDAKTGKFKYNKDENEWERSYGVRAIGIGTDTFDLTGKCLLTDCYSFAIDLFVRTNAQNANLILQTEAAQRLSNADPYTMDGAGSFVSFELNNMNLEQIKYVNDALCYVITDLTGGEILACAKGFLSDQAYTGEVVKAELYLCDFEIRNNTLSIGEKSDSDKIMPLVKNEATPISVYVYIDGEAATNEIAPALNNLNMQLNMQFATDVELIPVHGSFDTETKPGETTTPSEPTYSEELEYTLSDDGTYYSVSGIGTCLDTDVVIPKTYNGKPVREIGKNAFSRCAYLTSITIPDSIERIQRGDDDFNSSLNWAMNYGCTSLKEIIVDPANPYYTSENGVLYNKDKTSLIAYPAGKEGTSFTVPNSVTSIAKGAFIANRNLISVVVSDNVTDIAFGAFAICRELNDLVLPANIKEIPAGMVIYSQNLRSIHYMGTTEQWEALQKEQNWNVGCSNLTVYCNDPLIPSEGLAYTLSADGTCYSVSGIGTCKDTDIVIPATYEGKPVNSIGNDAFYGRNRLTSIMVPDSVTSIGEFAFSGCSSLTNITIPNGVASIGGSAFSNCSSLTSITIPDSVTSIGNNAFYECNALTNITIPSGLTSIGNRVFYNCKGLTSITIPNGVTSIGNSAFYNCKGLTSISIPDSVTSIGQEAFAYCSELTNIMIPNSVTTIGNSAFYMCTGITSVTISESLTIMGGSAFSGCSNLTSITFNGTTAQWKSIAKGSDWYSYTGSFTVHCIDGDISRAYA